MEASGAVLGRSPWCARDLLLRRDSSELAPHGCRPTRVSARPRRSVGGGGFSEEGHLRYYAWPARCGGGGKKEMEKEAKRRAKVVKGLSRDLAAFHAMGLGVAAAEAAGGVGPAGDFREGKMTISEAANVIMAQLELLRAKEEEMKRKRKEEKAAMKAAMRMKKKHSAECDDESSSSSSESSDSDCEEEAACSSSQRSATVGQTTLVEVLPNSDTYVPTLEQRTDNGVAALPNSDTRIPTLEQRTDDGAGDCNPMELRPDFSSSNMRFGSSSCSDKINGVVLAASTTSAAEVVSMEKVEVCMGGKCKKSGALELMREFEKQIGAEGVGSCKCMGKCRDGPNVRVVSGPCEGDESFETLRNPLCIGVGLEDVGTIVADFFGKKKGMGLLAA